MAGLESFISQRVRAYMSQLCVLGMKEGRIELSVMSLVTDQRYDGAHTTDKHCRNLFIERDRGRARERKITLDV